MMQQLVEDTRHKNRSNKRRVVLLSHSLGCLCMLWFLNPMDNTLGNPTTLRPGVPFWVCGPGPTVAYSSVTGEWRLFVVDFYWCAWFLGATRTKKLGQQFTTVANTKCLGERLSSCHDIAAQLFCARLC